VCLVFIAENQKPNSPKEKLSLSLFIRPAGKKKKVSLSSSLKSYVFSLCGCGCRPTKNKTREHAEEIKKETKRTKKKRQKREPCVIG
jgi:uncharacterized protein YutD